MFGTFFDVVKDPFTRNFPQFLAFVCDGLNLGSCRRERKPVLVFSEI